MMAAWLNMYQVGKQVRALDAKVTDHLADWLETLATCCLTLTMKDVHEALLVRIPGGQEAS